MEIKDFCTGVQHIGLPTNDLAKPFHSISLWALQQPTVPIIKVRK